MYDKYGIYDFEKQINYKISIKMQLDLRIGCDFFLEELIALKVVLAEVILDLTDDIGV